MSATDQQSAAQTFLKAFAAEVADQVAERLMAKQPQPEPNRLLTVAQVAERLSKSPRAVRDLTYAKNGQPPELPTVRLGTGNGSTRIEEDELAAFIERRRVAGKGTTRR